MNYRLTLNITFSSTKERCTLKEIMILTDVIITIIDFIALCQTVQ